MTIACVPITTSISPAAIFNSVSVRCRPEELPESLALLHRYAERAGRDPTEVEVAMKAPLYDTAMDSSASGSSRGRRRFAGSPDDVLQDVQTYSDLGVGHIIFDIRKPDLSETLERMDWFAAEVMAQSSKTA